MPCRLVTCIFQVRSASFSKKNAIVPVPFNAYKMQCAAQQVRLSAATNERQGSPCWLIHPGSNFNLYQMAALYKNDGSSEDNYALIVYTITTFNHRSSSKLLPFYQQGSGENDNTGLPIHLL